MHTMIFGRFKFHYNSDLSGSVRICEMHDEEENGVMVHKAKNEIKIVGIDLMNFIAEYVRQEKIRKLEEAHPHDVLVNT